MSDLRLLILLLLFGINALGQNDTADTCKCDFGDNSVFGGPEKLPAFPGGSEAMVSFLSEHLKYPEKAKNDSIEDTVYIRFCVKRDGNLKEIEILRGKYPLLNQEALRVIEKMPLWEPAENRGKRICYNVSLPIRFSLTKEESKKREYKRQ
ncbi:MAG: energy transducer TonB [Bacteroidota bacterium]